MVSILCDSCRYRWFLACVGDNAEMEFLWHGDELLIACRTEYWWELFQWDPNKHETRGIFPDGTYLLGKHPVLKRVLYDEDVNWLEPLWKEAGVEDPICNLQKYRKETPVPRDPLAQTKRFFDLVLPGAAGFPWATWVNMDYLRPGNSANQPIPDSPQY